ncbi:MAG: glycosyltransferase [Nitrospirota bacterium]
MAKVVKDLSEAQADQGNTVSIVTLLDEFTQKDKPENKNLSIFSCSARISNKFGYSLSLKHAIFARKDATDIVHMHGLWMYPNWVAGATSRKYSIPYVMSPHGMLDARSQQMGRWKKKIARILFENKNIENTACLHACSELEAGQIRSYGYNGPIAVVSSGLTSQDMDIASRTSKDIRLFSRNPRLTNKRKLLFFSRLHEQKGLQFLLEAWSSVRERVADWHLVIAGRGDKNYETALKNAIRLQGLSEVVTFLDPEKAESKWNIMKSADLLVLPSYSENFGLVIAEALACGVPVITTKGTPWKDLETDNCGWWLDVGREPLEHCLNKALILPDDQLVAMGQNGRRLIERKYLWEINAKHMLEVYRWAIGGGSKPDCVRMD